MTTKEIQLAVQKFLYDKSNHYQCLNYGKSGYYEADVLGVTPSMIVTEVEVKVSISDFKADFKKKHKHFRFQNIMQNNFTCIPNRFYYACPKGLINISHGVPGYAGLLWVDETGLVEVIKNAPMIHKEKAKDKLIMGMLSNLTAKTIFGMQKMTYDKMIRDKSYREKYPDLFITNQ